MSMLPPGGNLQAHKKHGVDIELHLSLTSARIARCSLRHKAHHARFSYLQHELYSNIIVCHGKTYSRMEKAIFAQLLQHGKHAGILKGTERIVRLTIQVVA